MPYRSADELSDLLTSETTSVLRVVDEVTRSVEASLKTISVETFNSLLDSDLAYAMRIYWVEMLQRTRLAALSSLVRTNRWMSGAADMWGDRNLLGFAACLRGMLESAADTAHSLKELPVPLAESSAEIRLALEGRISRGVFVAPELERALLHFQFADRKSKAEAAEESHIALGPGEYLKALDWDERGGVRDLYADLSALTHPSFHSLGTAPEENEVGLITRQAEEAAIRRLCSEHGPSIERAIVFPCNTGLLLLKLLNLFELPIVQTVSVDSFDADNIQAWRDWKSTVSKAKARPEIQAMVGPKPSPVLWEV